MNIETIRNIKQTGQLPPEFAERMKEHDRSIVERFGGEHMAFFPRTYAAIVEHMMENSVPMDVVDIGCDNGYQSEFFLEGKYLGIEPAPDCLRLLGGTFFNERENNVNYAMSKFPDKYTDVRKKTIISSMSLGWYVFNKNGKIKFRNPDDGYERDFKKFAEALSPAKNIYIRTTKKFASYLKANFSDHHVFDDRELDAHFQPEHCEMLYIRQ